MINICIDGPAGSGKSTLAKIVAKKLNILYLDTGATFRALGLKAIRWNVDVKNERMVKKLLDLTSVDISFENGEMKVYLDKEDVTNKIRENCISKYASDISAYKETREKLITDWRRIANTYDVIIDGRDIGTVVLPDSKYKFYLTADSLERAKRRHMELLAKDEFIPIDVLQKQIEERDYNDSTREHAPLKRADDAVLLDSTSMSPEELASIVIERVEKGENK